MKAVYPGLDADEMHELIRANERIKIVREVESKASKLEDLEEKVRLIQSSKE